MSEPVSLSRQGDIAIVSVDNPPVNALSLSVRSGLQASFAEAQKSDAKIIVLLCKGRTFFAGADISEFGKQPADPWLPQVLNEIAACRIPVVAAVHGTALGGGLETAMACHYRIAAPSARVGLPEVRLGLLPGAGGTQWLPRLVGIETALDMMISGKPIPADVALEKGLLDRLAGDDLTSDALAYAQELIETGAGPRPTKDMAVRSSHLPEGFFAATRSAVAKKTRGLPAPQRIIDCVEAAATMEYEDAAALERKLFMVLMRSPESAGLRHVFFAERQAAKIDGLPRDTAIRQVSRVAIVGAGTMGGGIAMSFANAGIPVTLLEINREALDKGIGLCRKNYERSAKKGRFTSEQVEQMMDLISGTTSYEDLSDADLVIEAVFENPEIKCQVFRKLDEVCKAGAILASNTSYQDIDAIAAVTSRPQDVLGMHFFSPANIMKLLEVVRGEQTADDVLATAMKLAKKIGKVAVLARVGYGFIGNRMLRGYMREAQLLLLEGATPVQVDTAMEGFGMAMGPLAVADLAGLDIGYKARKAIPDYPDHAHNHVVDQLVEMGRLGQKSGAGFYRYDPETRQRMTDPEVDALIAAESAALEISRRDFSDEDIVERIIYSLVNEGAKVLEEGIAQRADDIDIVYIYGYGFPAHRGGPMFYASSVGLDKVYRRICDFRDSLDADNWQPAPLLERLAKEKATF